MIEKSLASDNQQGEQTIVFTHVENEQSLPTSVTMEQLALFFHEKMKPYHDTLEDVRRALDYAFSGDSGKGGFAVLATMEEQLVGAVLILHTGMGGYVPENLLLFVVVDPVVRGKGIGGQIIKRAIARCEGDVKLHVEVDNPARRLYTKLGFDSKYVEMRYKKSNE